MPRFAVIQDGTETVRQRFADVVDCYKTCAADLSDGRFVQFSFEVFTDERVGPLLEALDPDDWACVVFASNALLSGEVEDAVTRRPERLHGYVQAGGGLVVLHQQRDDLSPLLPPDMLPLMAERTSKRGATATRPADGAEADLLLRFPGPVEWSCLRDIGPDELDTLRGAGRAVELPSFFFKVLDRDGLPASLKPVLVSTTGEVVICRAQDHVDARVVLATPPLDWQADRPGQGAAATALLCNAIRYASLGRPRRLVWYRAEATDNELLLRWLNRDGGAAIHAAPAGTPEIGPTDAWLLETVDAFVLPADRLDAVEERDETVRYLERGGALIATANARSGGASRVTALLGRHEERSLASTLFAELRAVDGWRSADHAFELRNIVQALAFLLRDEVHRTNTAATDPRSLDELRPKLCERLTSPEHREDLGSSIALVQCLAHIEPDDGPLAGEYVDWLDDEEAIRPFDLALQIRGVLAFGRRRPDPAFLRDALAALAAARDDMSSVAPLGRVLRTIAMLDQTGLLPDDPDSAIAIAELCGRSLAGFSSFRPEAGCRWRRPPTSRSASSRSTGVSRRTPRATSSDCWWTPPPAVRQRCDRRAGATARTRRAWPGSHA